MPSTNRLNLAIALPLQHQDELKQFVQSVSDPHNPNYRHYLKPAQFARQFGPSISDYKSLKSFCQKNGWKITGAHGNRLLLDVNAPVADVERVFHVKINLYQQPAEGRTFYAPDSAPEIDSALPVLDVRGLDDYALAKPMDGSGFEQTYLGGDFRAAYAPGVTLTGAGQQVALVQFDGYSSSDITAYENETGLPNVPLQNVLLDGFNGVPGGNQDEVALDIEMSMAMAPGLSGIIVYMAPNWGSSFYDVLNRIATDDLASQVSSSWDFEAPAGDAVMDQILQQMAAQGQSFFCASGDSGAFNDGYFYYPAGSPYTTSVGGTELTTTGPGGAYISETAWFGSSGGVSTAYSIPSWQQGVANAANGASTTMRNVPDVSLTAWAVDEYVEGEDIFQGGTSCAAPLWAGFMALVNQEAAMDGLAPVGFANPLIYSIGGSSLYSSCFNDVTTGDNNGFNAVPGYDLCTGWGSPAGQPLIDALANPDPLEVWPLSGFAASGAVGGTFSGGPQTLTLQNIGSAVVNWSANNTVPWLTVSPVSGSLPPGQTLSVTVSLNAAEAQNMLVGNYSGSIVFTDQNTSVTFSRQYSLTVTGPPIEIQKIPGAPGCVIITWSAPGVLQSSPTLGPGAVWTTIVGATSPYTNCDNGSQEFFRIVNTYYGNSLTQTGFEGADGEAPLVILGEYSPAGPLPNSSVTLPAGAVQDVQFYGDYYDFTLYALSLVSTSATGEQTFVITASQHFGPATAATGAQLLHISSFTVSAGELLAFAGIGPYYPQSPNDALNSDATYEDSTNPDSFIATPPVGVGTTFSVGQNPDPNATYEYISDYFGNQGRTYAIGVDIWPQ